MTILQEEYTITSAIQDNMVGAILFFLFLSIAGMYIFMWLLPRFRNATVVGLTFMFLIVMSVVGAIVIWPEFWKTLEDNIFTGLAAAAGGLIGGAFLGQIVVVLIFGLIIGAIAGRGLLSRGSA